MFGSGSVTAKVSAPICSSPATAPAPACVANSLPQVQPIYSGYYIWRGAPNEPDLSPETRATVFPYFSFFLADQLQILGYPIAGEDELRPGHRRYNFAGTAWRTLRN